jgi:hypothetical protein
VNRRIKKKVLKYGARRWGKQAYARALCGLRDSLHDDLIEGGAVFLRHTVIVPLGLGDSVSRWEILRRATQTGEINRAPGDVARRLRDSNGWKVPPSISKPATLNQEKKARLRELRRKSI